jgi:hypothetical protein
MTMKGKKVDSASAQRASAKHEPQPSSRIEALRQHQTPLDRDAQLIFPLAGMM